MIEQQKCTFFVLRYVPDAVKNEFVNVGLVLLPQAGRAELRFTRDWSRVKCLDPQADMDLLEALEADLRDKLLEPNGDRDFGFILRKIQDSFSNALQPSEFKACLAESPAEEADALAEMYLEAARRRAPREASGRQAIFVRMRQEFEGAGVWPLMRQGIRAADYTRAGDPLKIDCGYSPNGTVKMFHALALPADSNAVNAAKVLAFSFPQLAEGVRKKENKQAQLTAVVEDELPRQEDFISFALEILERQKVQVAMLTQMPQIAAQAARELGIG